MTEDQILKQIAEINDTLNLGLTSVDNGGLKSTMDLKALRQRRNELQRELAGLQTGQRPSIFRRVQL